MNDIFYKYGFIEGILSTLEQTFPYVTREELKSKATSIIIGTEEIKVPEQTLYLKILDHYFKL